MSGDSLPDPMEVLGRRSMRHKLIGALLIGAVGAGASVMSCVGQSFSLRQARAMETIAEQLTKMQQGCTAYGKDQAR